MSHDVFVSYASRDKLVADAVCAGLERNGVRCWIAPRDVTPGVAYGEAIIGAIHGCRVMVLVFSSKANESAHIPKEVERAVSLGVTVVPFRVEDVLPSKSLEYFIGSVHWLDAMTPPLEQHLPHLLTVVKTLLLPRPLPPRPAGAETMVGPIPVNRAPAAGPASPTPPAPRPNRTAFVLGGAGLVAAGVAGWLLLRPGEPLVGTWTWPNGAVASIQKNGTIQLGNFAGTWRVTDRGSHRYTLTWPPAIDQVTMSSDGNRLTGGNQYGVPLGAIRLSAPVGDPITGSWRWGNGAVVSIGPGGSMQAGPFAGRWQAIDPGARTYTFTWPPPVDAVVLSADDSRLEGVNQYGFPLVAVRRQ